VAQGGAGRFVRDLIVPFGGSSYVALLQIEDESQVTGLAVRHQFEQDYHWHRVRG